MAVVVICIDETFSAFPGHNTDQLGVLLRTLSAFAALAPFPTIHLLLRSTLSLPSISLIIGALPFGSWKEGRLTVPSLAVSTTKSDGSLAASENVRRVVGLESTSFTSITNEHIVRPYSLLPTVLSVTKLWPTLPQYARGRQHFIGGCQRGGRGKQGELQYSPPSVWSFVSSHRDFSLGPWVHRWEASMDGEVGRQKLNR